MTVTPRAVPERIRWAVEHLPLRRALAPGGSLLIAYGAGPRPDRQAELLERVRAAVDAHGFAAPVVLREERGSGVRAGA